MDNKLSELSKPVAWDFPGSKEESRQLGYDFELDDEQKVNCSALYSQEYVSALDKVAQFWIGESAGWKKRAEDAEKRIAELEGQLQSGFTPEALAQEERAENAEQRVAELEAKTAMTMGVGSGNGNLFVHGDYDSIKAAQAIVLENESLRAKLATPVRLPDMRQSSSGDRYQWSDGAHNYRLDVISILLGAGLTVAVEGDDA